MEDFIVVMKATFLVYLTFSPAIIIPCLLSKVLDKPSASRGRKELDRRENLP